MKKRLQLLFLFVGMIIICFTIVIHKSKQIKIQINGKGEICVLLSTDKLNEQISTWWNEREKRYYVFLPSFCNGADIYVENRTGCLFYIDDILYEHGDKFAFVDNQTYLCEIINDKGEISIEEIVFMRSQNIPTLFINVESGNMEYLLENKDNKESANISIVNVNGNVEYSGIVEKISGRGNSTWKSYDKKSYAISLLESKSLCGLEAGKDWNLLAVHGEGNRMTTKVTMDMAEYIGMDVTMNTTWIDVYFNGEYAGNYLLSEAVKIDEARVNIYDLEKENKTNNGVLEEYHFFEEDNYKGYELPNVETIAGGFLIEKDIEDYFNEEKVGFKTDLGNCFTIKAPKHASREQVEYIYSFINEIDKKIEQKDSSVLKYIDVESFAKRYLIDELTLNTDANITSMYFYKDKGEDKLYAGPIWDCDSGMGICNAGWMEGRGVNYEWSVNEGFRSESLAWNRVLLENEEFLCLVKEEFKKILPFMEKMLETDIFEYEKKLAQSTKMDMIRWERKDVNETWIDNYQTYENNVRHMRYFLIKRLNYLIDIWNIPYEKFEFEGNGKEHIVQYVIDGVIVETKIVMDGEEVKENPYLDEEIYWGWYYTYNDKKTREWLPVFEDCTFYARRK